MDPVSLDTLTDPAYKSRKRHAIELALVVGGLHAYFLWGRFGLLADVLVLAVLTVVVVASLRRRGETRRSLGIALDRRAWITLRLLVPVVVVAVAGSLLFRGLLGAIAERPIFPGIAVALLAYPLWGFAQQLFYLGFLGRGLVHVGVSKRRAALIAGLLFGLVHVPNWPLVGVTLPYGLIAASIYVRAPALLPIGLVHGIGGACMIYLVGLDLEIGATYPGF